MAEGGRRTPRGKAKAQKAAPELGTRPSPGDAAPELVLDHPVGSAELILDRPVGPPRSDTFAPLVTALGGGVLDFSAMLAIADILPVMTAYVDRELVYRFVNKPLAQWIGLPRREILGRPIRDVIGAESFEQRVPMYQAALAGERTFYASEFEHPARGHVAVQSDYVPWADATGEVRGIIILFEDKTEQRAAEKALKESEERFRRIANSAPAMMWVTRPDRSRDFVNEAYAAFAIGPDGDLEAARTLDWRARIHPDDHDRIVAESIAGEAEAGSAGASGKRFTLEARYLRHDGEYRWLRSVSQPRFGPDGEFNGFIGVATDITLAKEAELDLKRQVEQATDELLSAQEQLRQSQKMEALGQLTGGIAHDFNNLLTVVVGGLDIIAKRSPDKKLKRYADNALAAAERGARLTGQLLAFSRVQRLEVRPVGVAPLIEAMRPLLRNVLGPGISKEFALDEEMVPVMADPTQLEVAVLNLAINARDAMPDGGVLKFATRILEVKDDPELDSGRYVELTISDTGVGMTADVAARAFEPFFTTKEVGKGTGLGLSMVYGMARQSGGTARIESDPGTGTAVKLYFRAAEIAGDGDAASPDAEAAQAGGRRKRASVLVIDDDPDVRGFIAATLEELGYRVRQASDGEHGLKELSRETPDLVVLDFIMPGLSGAEVASRILAKRPGQPILFVSGYSETEAVKRTAPDAPLLMKPFRSEALEQAVRAALAPPG
jgi:PAS domain S-box-containing protein